MRIAYVSVASPFSRASWSGIPWYSHREILRRFPDTHVIDTPRTDAIVQRLATVERYGVLVRRRNAIARHYSRLINEALERLRPDMVVAVAAAHKIAYIDPKWPLIYAADAMFATVVDYYSEYARFGHRMRMQGNRVQDALLQRADRILLCSDWAVAAARDAYDLADDQLRVLPMGANLDEDPGYEPPDPDRPLTLMFMGYAWERKGGDLALEVWRELRRRIGNVEFHIVGAKPASAAGLEGVHLHGRLNKTDRRDYGRIVELFRQSHFFIMPSRQEAYGIVYCEAAAFGRPAVAAATGGVTTIIDDGRSGLLLPTVASAADYADRILATWSDKAAYLAMCTGARDRFRSVLNWNSWGEGVVETIDAVQRSATRQGNSNPD